MEINTKKSGGVEIPKKNRSLDLKSLYESKFSEVRDSKKKVSDENDGENVKKKKRKSRKEVPLSCFESDAKKSRKEDVNGVKPELEFGRKSKDRSEGLHDISLPLGNNGSSFNIPKRPRGSVGRKRLESDQGSEPTRHSDSADTAGEFKAEVTKSEDGLAPNDRLVQLATPSSAIDCVSSAKSKGKNAARMLSSRFDPSCTGFSSKIKSSVSQKADGLLFSSSSAQDSFTRPVKTFADGQSASADDQSRTLRPRRENAGKGVSRKRRHFYEILAQDLDPYWVLKRRIKVFWPLDESWYYGLVNDYNSETKHHHIKYDDREEEIVNLQDEKFKLLLLPSEVPDKLKSRKRSRGVKDSPRGQTVPSAGDDSCTGDPLDSEPIASWLATQSQRAKASPKSLKRQRTSQKHLPLVSSLSSEKTDNSNSDVVDSKIFRNNPDCESASVDSLLESQVGNNSLLGSTHTSQSEKHMVYVRKKYRRTSKGGSSMSRDVKACSVGLLPTKGMSDKLLWSFDDQGKLRLKDFLLESEKSKFQICLPVLPSLESSFEIGNFWLLHDIFMLQHGVLVTSSPAVVLEMLFIDTNFGMRFFLYDGCLRQAVALIFQILIAFSQFDEQWNDGMKLPVTSIRFQLSSSQDPRKQHVFAFYSFSKLKSSKWPYLDSEILQHCLLIKQLPISECTYDNIKELECGNFQPRMPCDGLKHSLNEGFKKKFVSGILPMGVSREARNKRMSQSTFNLAAKPGKVPQFALYSWNIVLLGSISNIRMLSVLQKVLTVVVNHLQNVLNLIPDPGPFKMARLRTRSEKQTQKFLVSMVLNKISES
ncbi:hypothetical protein C2S52_008707 [Perilla frutescens var. hirtella]|nr:hypothetical protein C2S52_008707 [Perilla frutescens var. hirtella]